jgi:hypothetical protein
MPDTDRSSPSLPAPAADVTASAVLAEIAAHPRGDDLARLAHTLAFAAFDERRTSVDAGLTEAAERAGLSYEDAETRFGNALRALERAGTDAAGSAARALVGGLVARGVALSPPEGDEAEARVAEALVWLAAHTPVDALASLDAAHPRAAAGLWAAVAGVVRRVDAGKAPLVGRAGALVAAAALRHVGSAAAREEASALATEVRDPVVRSILRGSAPIDSGEVVAAGELVPPPRGPVALALLGFTGLLAVGAVGRLLARYLLQLRRPAELRVTAHGVTVIARTELLGRVVTQREVHVPLESLARATREVRYPRVAAYTGLVALALGSYFGVSLVVDGARSGSPDLLGLGALLVVGGLVLDFVLGSVLSSSAGRCRVVVVPRKGPTLAVGRVDPALATLALGRLQGQG